MKSLRIQRLAHLEIIRYSQAPHRNAPAGFFLNKNREDTCLFHVVEDCSLQLAHNGTGDTLYHKFRYGMQVRVVCVFRF